MLLEDGPQWSVGTGRPRKRHAAGSQIPLNSPSKTGLGITEGELGWQLLGVGQVDVSALI